MSTAAMLTTQEAGELLGVSDARVRQMILAGQIKAQRFGQRMLLVPEKEIERVKKIRKAS